VLVALLLAGCGNESGPRDRERKLRLVAPPPPTVEAATPKVEFDVAGIETPRVLSAQASMLPEDALVIGVTVGSVARAYLISAFDVPHFGLTELVKNERARAMLGRHVINDVVGGTPVSVTYCDRNRCARVLTDPDAVDPLEVRVGGWDNGMLLLIDGERVPQRAEGLPFEDLPYKITTWKEWRASHPDTDVYVGG
jgi:hypothetical protein